MTWLDNATQSAHGPPVVLVAGTSRCGSTLLEEEIRRRFEVTQVGELYGMLRADYGFDEVVCGCGARLVECPFWGRVVEETFGGWESPVLEQTRATLRELVRTRSTPALYSSRAPGGRCSEVHALAVTWRRLMVSTAAAGGSQPVLDSSKSFEYAAFLRGWVAVPLFLVVLVRDLRGVLYSQRKRDVGIPWRPGHHMPTPGAGAVISRWMKTYTAYDMMLASRTVPGLLLRYEDLARSPEAVIGSLGREIGLRSAKHAGSKDASPAAHPLRGNPRRSEPIVSSPDLAWHKGLPLRWKLASTTLGMPLLARHGYL